MAEAGRFIKEEVVELPATDRWLNADGRSVRVFAKGPSAGINAETGVALLLHGIGGRQNDIAWKILRKELADKHNLLVVGVNFFGTGILGADNSFMQRQFQRAYDGLRHDPSRFGALTRGENLTLSREEYAFFENAQAALTASLPFPDEFWDWGLIQALDCINALAWAETQSGIKSDRVSMVSVSAGAQIAYNLMKFLPGYFGAFLDLGGACYGREMAPWLEQLLDDPFGKKAASEIYRATVASVDPVYQLTLSRRLPHPRLGTRYGSGASIADEAAIRDVTRTSHLTDKLSIALIRAEQGILDECYSPAYKQGILREYEARGAETSLRVIGEDDIDGNKRVTIRHSITKDFGAIVLEEYDEIFATRRHQHPENDGLASEHAFACPGGNFHLKCGQASKLRFEKTAPASGGRA